MRISTAVCLLVGLAIGSIGFGADQTTKVLDDFSSAEAVKAWQVRPDATITAEKDGLHLVMPKYAGQPGEGQWPGMERPVPGVPLAQYNGVLIDVTNATDHRLPLGVGFHDSKGGTSMFEEIGPKERKTVKIYFDRMISGVADWSDIQRITVTWTTPPRDMVWVFHKIEMFCDDPATTELGQLQELVKSTQEAFAKAEAAKALTDSQAAAARRLLSQWSDAVATTQSIRGKGADCRVQLGALQSQLRLAGLAGQLKAPMVAWSVPVGTRFEPDGAMLQYHEPVEKLKLHGAKGQYDDAIVRVTNLSDAEQDWQVAIEAAEPSISSAMSIRRNQAVLASDRTVVGDALVPLDRAGVLHVGPGQTAELWVRADLKHHQWKPGMNEANLVFKDLRRGVASIVKLPVEVEVWNFDLAEAPGMHLSLWASLYWGNASMLAGREQAALDNWVDYGCDVLTINPDQFPWPKLTAAGEPAGPLDFESFDRLIKLYRSKGNPIILIWLGLDDSHPDMQQLRSGLPVYSPQWEKTLHWWLGQITDRMKSLGVPTSQYALYITDEPNEAELDLTIKVAQVAKSIDPSVQIYMDSSELYEDQKRNDQLMKLVDINQPNGDGMAARPHLLAELKKYPNCTLWMYQCRTNTRARQLVKAYDYYRLQAWQAMNDGMKGIGFWVYAYNAQKDFWDETTSNGGGAGMVYADSGDGLLMSVRWELVRMSLDDMRYYQLLAKAPGTAQTKSLLGKRFQEVLDHPQDPQRAIQWRLDAARAIAAADQATKQ